MTKVFSKEKCIKDIRIEESEVDLDKALNWINECEGLTKEQINDLGYETKDIWMVEKEDNPKVKDNKASIDLKVNVDDEGLEDTVDMLREATELLPNITIRNNEQVYVTINNFSVPAKEYYKED